MANATFWSAWNEWLVEKNPLPSDVAPEFCNNATVQHLGLYARPDDAADATPSPVRIVGSVARRPSDPKKFFVQYRASGFETLAQEAFDTFQEALKSAVKNVRKLANGEVLTYAGRTAADAVKRVSPKPKTLTLYPNQFLNRECVQGTEPPTDTDIEKTLALLSQKDATTKVDEKRKSGAPIVYISISVAVLLLVLSAILAAFVAYNRRRRRRRGRMSLENSPVEPVNEPIVEPVVVNKPQTAASQI